MNSCNKCIRLSVLGKFQPIPFSVQSPLSTVPSHRCLATCSVTFVCTATCSITPVQQTVQSPMSATCSGTPVQKPVQSPLSATCSVTPVRNLFSHHCQQPQSRQPCPGTRTVTSVQPPLSTIQSPLCTVFSNPCPFIQSIHHYPALQQPVHCTLTVTPSTHLCPATPVQSPVTPFQQPQSSHPDQPSLAI